MQRLRGAGVVRVKDHWQGRAWHHARGWESVPPSMSGLGRGGPAALSRRTSRVGQRRYPGRRRRRRTEPADVVVKAWTELAELLAALAQLAPLEKERLLRTFVLVLIGARRRGRRGRRGEAVLRAQLTVRQLGLRAVQARILTSIQGPEALKVGHVNTASFL